jgi:hypothetical protein
MTDLLTHAEFQAIAHDQYTELKTIWIDLSDRDRADSIE